MRLKKVVRAGGAAILFCLGQVGGAADPAAIWTPCNSGTTNDLRAVTFGQNKLVAVGGNGTIATSTDGVAWTVQNSGTQDYLRAIAYGAPGFLAVGAGGSALTSPDGVAWTVHDAGAGPLLGVAYLGGQFFAVGGAGRNGALIVSSPDGVKWTVVLSSATHSNLPTQLDSIAYGNGRFVATHYDQYGGGGATSSDGNAWTVTDGAGAAICFGNGVFASVGSYQTRDPATRVVYSRAFVATSGDGLRWAPALDIPGYLDAIGYGPPGFVAVGGPLGATGSSFDDGVRTLLTSPDGINWKKRGSPPGGLGITWANDQFFLLGWGGVVLRSLVGAKLETSFSNGQFLGSISGINGQQFAIQMSTDLASWGALTNIVVINGTAQFADPSLGVMSRRFYQAVVINR